MAADRFAIGLKMAVCSGLVMLSTGSGLVAGAPRVAEGKLRAGEPRPRVSGNSGAPLDKLASFDGETREFRVSVDGKERGRCTMRIDRCDDGVDRLQIDSRIRVNYAVFEFRYASAGTEHWKEDRLIELARTCDYNGARYSVNAGVGTKGLRVTTNGRPAHADFDTWVTSYWHLPERLARLADEPREAVVPSGGPAPSTRAKAQIVPLLDSDQGRILRGELRYIGEETVVAGGERKPARHFRVTGDVEADLWYDARLRLVRQESVDQGHQTVLELLRVTDPASPDERSRPNNGLGRDRSTAPKEPRVDSRSRPRFEKGIRP